uniref:Mitoferrin-1 n=1 Tax=Schistocephalus solidus TaxID=70667 RepID=A0A0X3NH82_SCHSO
MLAGASAGFMEHSIMYPVDCVKTRLQCIRPSGGQRYLSVSDGLYRLLRQEGFFKSFRGIGAVVAGAGPAHALYFALYEQLKKRLSSPTDSNHLLHAFSGASATLVHDAIMTPTDGTIASSFISSTIFILSNLKGVFHQFLTICNEAR